MKRCLILAAAVVVIALSVMPARAERPCPGEVPVPWAGPTLYSGGFHFAVLGGVTESIAVFRRLHGLPQFIGNAPMIIFNY